MAACQPKLLKIIVIFLIVQRVCSAAPQGVSDRSSDLTDEITAAAKKDFLRRQEENEADKSKMLDVEKLKDEFEKQAETDMTTGSKPNENTILSLMDVLNKYTSSLVNNRAENTSKHIDTGGVENTTESYQREIIDSETKQNDNQLSKDADEIKTIQNEETEGSHQTTVKNTELSPRVPLTMKTENISEIKNDQTQNEGSDHGVQEKSELSPQMQVEDKMNGTARKSANIQPSLKFSSKVSEIKNEPQETSSDAMTVFSPRFLTEKEHSELISKFVKSSPSHSPDSMQNNYKTFEKENNTRFEDTANIPEVKKTQSSDSKNIHLTSRMREEISSQALPSGMFESVIDDIKGHKEIMTSLKENTDDLVTQLRTTNNMDKLQMEDPDMIKKEQKGLSNINNMTSSANASGLSHNLNNSDSIVNISENNQNKSINVRTSETTSDMLLTDTGRGVDTQLSSRLIEGNSPQSDTASIMPSEMSSVVSEDINRHRETMSTFKKSTDDLIAQFRTVSDNKSKNQPHDSFDSLRLKTEVLDEQQISDVPKTLIQEEQINTEESSDKLSDAHVESDKAVTEFTGAKNEQPNETPPGMQSKYINHEKMKVSTRKSEGYSAPSGVEPSDITSTLIEDITRHKEIMVNFKEQTDDLVAQMRTLNNKELDNTANEKVADSNLKTKQQLSNNEFSVENSKLKSIFEISDAPNSSEKTEIRRNSAVPEPDKAVGLETTQIDPRLSMQDSQLFSMPSEKSSAVYEDDAKHKDMIVNFKDSTDDLLAQLRIIKNKKIGDNANRKLDTNKQNSKEDLLVSSSRNEQTKTNLPQLSSQEDQIGVNENSNKSSETYVNTNNEAPDLPKVTGKLIMEMTPAVKLKETEQENVDVSSRIKEVYSDPPERDTLSSSDIPTFVSEDIARHKERLVNFKHYNDEVFAQLRTIKENATKNLDRLSNKDLGSLNPEILSFNTKNVEESSIMPDEKDAMKIMGDLSRPGSGSSKSQQAIDSKMQSGEMNQESIQVAPRITEENSDQTKLNLEMPSQFSIAEDISRHNNMMSNFKENTDNLAAQLRKLNNEENQGTENDSKKHLEENKKVPEIVDKKRSNTQELSSTEKVSPRIRSGETIPFSNDDINFEILKSNSGDIKPRMQSDTTLKEEEIKNQHSEDIEGSSVEKKLTYKIMEENDSTNPEILKTIANSSNNTFAYDHGMSSESEKKLQNYENRANIEATGINNNDENVSDSGIASSSALLEDILNMEIGSSEISDNDDSKSDGDRATDDTEVGNISKIEDVGAHRPLIYDILQENLNNAKKAYETTKVLNSDIHVTSNKELEGKSDSNNNSKAIEGKSNNFENVRNEKENDYRPDRNYLIKENSATAISVSEHVFESQVEGEKKLPVGVSKLQEEPQTENFKLQTEGKLDESSDKKLDQLLINQEISVKKIETAQKAEVTNYHQDKEAVSGESEKLRAPADRIDLIIKYMMEVSDRISNLETNVQQIKEDAAFVRNAVVKFLMTSRR